MNLSRINKILLWGASILLVAALVLWAFLHFMMHTSATQSSGSGSILSTLFGTSDNNQPSDGTGTSATGTNQPLGGAVNGLQQKIFEISTGPVAGAVFVQSGMPTTTIARYVMADSGHVFDLAVGVPGAVAKSVSNTTIPGLINALWAQNVSNTKVKNANGSAVVLQYLENSTIKTVFVGFPVMATSTATSTTPVASPVQIRFLPDNIASIATSPDGTSVAYLLLTNSGSTGYIASANGASSRALFTLPLSQVTIAWPSAGTLMATTKPDANSQGIAFSISTKTGAVTQLLYAQGLTALADKSFSTVVYQSTANGTRLSYAHNVATGGDLGLSFQPSPEKCIWSPTATSTLFCAAPTAYTPINYLDLWHQGLLNSPDALFVFNTLNGASLALASPGSTDGGVAASIASVGISPDGKYLLYITRGDRALWGVRLVD